MDIQGDWNVFLAGCLGGVFAELLHWWNLRTSKREEIPEYIHSLRYWVITLAMILAGGTVCWLYFGQRVEGPVALHVGLTTPLLLQKLIASVPEQTGARKMITKSQASILSFFKW